MALKLFELLKQVMTDFLITVTQFDKTDSIGEFFIRCKI